VLLDPVYDERLDYPLQMRIFGMCVMNHQYAAAAGRARVLEALVAERPPGSRDVPDALPDVVEEALVVFPAVLDTERRTILGDALPAHQATNVEKARQAFYDKWFR